MWAPWEKALLWPAATLTFFLFLFEFPAKSAARRITCNYCYNADKMDDCFYSQRKCEHKQICFVDTSKVTFASGTDQERTSYMYKMGCAYSSICKDGVSYGPGPNGYSRIVRQCCCSPRCTEGDGSGKGKYDLCPWAMPNATDVSNDADRLLRTDDWLMAWTAIPTTLSFIWGLFTYIFS